ncbi:hypothetical protein BYT27DRAFT_7248866 [Phlegmacium glaucopus]|nr:hypothetical protein BYT27DRAFT_7248866 [Phlegmacium glaucopus]
MAPYIKHSALSIHPSISRLYTRFLNIHSKIHKLSKSLLHKIPAGVFKKLKAREFFAPISSYHADDTGPGPGPDTASLSSNLGEGGVLGTGAPTQHRLYQASFNHISVWAYLALAFVILAAVTIFSYMVYSCYHTAGLRARSKSGDAVGAGADGGWQSLEDPVGEMGDGRMLAKDREVGEKVDNYQDANKEKDINPWSEGRGSGLKGLGIHIHRSTKSQYDLPNESQASSLSGSPHSTCTDGSLGMRSNHEQDLESPEGSDYPSMSAQPLAHTTERSATYHLPMPLPLPLPLPPPVTPSPYQVKHKRTRLRALTQILSLNATQNQKSRETNVELQPMIATENGVGQSKGLSETSREDESSPQASLSPLSSLSKFSPVQFGFFAPYPNCNSTSTTSNSNSNATSHSWDNNSSCSPTTFPTTPITPSTPITPMTPVTPIKPGPSTTELQYDSNNIQFIETPARSSDASSPGASPPEIQGALAAVSINSLTRAEMLWNDPKLSPVQGAFGVAPALGGEKTSSTEVAIAKTISVWQTQSAFGSGAGSLHIPAPSLATPDHIHRAQVNPRLGYLRRGVSLSSPPSPSPSSYSSHSSSNSVSSSPSIATARFILDREELKRDNLRNRDSRAGLDREKGREKVVNMKALSPIPRPVFLPHFQPSGFQVEQSF